VDDLDVGSRWKVEEDGVGNGSFDNIHAIGTFS
jgi:hypothetical protein